MKNVRILQATEEDLIHKLTNFCQSDIEELKIEILGKQRLKRELTDIQGDLAKYSLGIDESGFHSPQPSAAAGIGTDGGDEDGGEGLFIY